MSDLAYHFGLKMRFYPSDKQKQIIKANYNVARTVYNKLVGRDKELFQLRKVSHNWDYFKLIAYLIKQDDISLRLAVFMVNNHFVSKKTIKEAKATKCYKYNDYTGWFFDYRIDQLKARFKTMKKLAGYYLYMQDDRLDSLMPCNAQMNYHRAWNNYFQVHRAGTPKFHKKGYSGSYQTTAQYNKVKDKHDPAKKVDRPMTVLSANIRFTDETFTQVKLPKLGVVRVAGVRKKLLENKKDIKIGTVTIEKTASERYYLAMQLGSNTPFVKPKQKTNSILGVDLNLDNFLTDSNGAMVANPRFYRKMKKKLAKAQRILSRRQRRAKQVKKPLRLAKDYQRQRKLVSKLHEKIRSQRSDFINNLTTALVDSQDLVVAEKLMSKNLAKNHALAMSLTDAGWREFLAKMKYKADLYGKLFIMIDPKNTTQTCANCGHIMGHDDTPKLTLSDRRWVCPVCGASHIRDWNAAVNILKKGIKKLGLKGPSLTQYQRQICRFA